MYTIQYVTRLDGMYKKQSLNTRQSYLGHTQTRSLGAARPGADLVKDGAAAQVPCVRTLDVETRASSSLPVALFLAVSDLLAGRRECIDVSLALEMCSPPPPHIIVGC